MSDENKMPSIGLEVVTNPLRSIRYGWSWSPDPVWQENARMIRAMTDEEFAEFEKPHLTKWEIEAQRKEAKREQKRRS